MLDLNAIKKTLKKVCNEVVLLCFKLLSPDLAERTDENHDSWSAG